MNFSIGFIIIAAGILDIIWVLYELRRKKWAVLGFIRGESIERIEQKLAGYDKSVIPKVMCNEDGYIVSINEEAKKLFGWTEDELTGSTLERILPDDFWKAYWPKVPEMKGQEITDKKFIILCMTKQLQTVPIEFLLRKSRIGKKFFYVVNLRDISEQVAETDKLKAEIEDLKKQVEIMDKGEELGRNGSWFWDIDKDNLRGSKGYARILGMEETNYKAKFLKSRVWPEDEQVVNQALKDVFSGNGYDIIYRQLRYEDLQLIFIRSITEPKKNERGVVKYIYGYTRHLRTANIVEEVKKLKKGNDTTDNME